MNNNDLFQASRRRFLAQLGGLTVAGMLGPSLLTPRMQLQRKRRLRLSSRKRAFLPGRTGGLSARR